MLDRIHNGHVLGVAAFAVPILGLYAPRGLAPLVIVVALVAVAVRWRRGGPWPVPRHAAAIVLAGLIAWAAASLAWTIAPPAAAARNLASLAVLVACGLVVVEIAAGLDAAERRSFVRGLLAGFIVALALLAVERAADYPLRRALPLRNDSPNTLLQAFNRGLTVMALVAFPVALALWRWSRLAATGAWAATLALLAVMPSTAAIAALAAGGAVAALAYAAPRVTPAALGAALLAGVLVAPIGGQTIPAPADFPQEATALPGSAHHRLMIWRFTAQRVSERPLLGWGFDSSRSIPGRTESLGTGEPALPLHPHNVALQWWLELGLPGALIGAAFLTVLVAGIARHLPGRAEAAAGQGLLVAATVVAGVSYGAWQGWWIAALALSAALMAAAASAKPPAA